MCNNLLTVDKLLSYDLFYDNEYLHKYVDLINSNINREKEKYITERHHIIPKVYYKKNKLDVDNSEDNLVNLIYYDHVLAHCLLCLSFKYDYYISASIDAIYAIINNNTDKDFKYSNLEDIVANFEYLKPLLKCKHFVDEDQKIKLSVISSNSK